MIIWTPADNGRGGGDARLIRADFLESPVPSERPAKAPSPDVVFIAVEDTPCRPRAVADEEWCGLDQAATGPRKGDH